MTSQLIDTMTGAHIWAEHFDGDADATFDRQDDITRSVIGALATSLERAETERAKKRPTAAYAAYDHFLVGMAAIYEGTRASNARALDHFAKATTIDPNFSAAYAMSCYCYVWRKASGWPSGSNEISRPRVGLGSIGNRSCGLDTSIELLPPRRQHLPA